MSASIIPTLEAERQTYINQREQDYQQRTQCEQAYESLCSFKTMVLQSQEEFHTINSHKAGMLSGVEEVKENSITAQRYFAGMQNIFYGIGAKSIAAIYTVLLTTISAKLKSYENAVNDYGEEIFFCNIKIAELDIQIEIAKTAEKLAKFFMGGGL